MIEYPPDFPSQARAAVERAMAEAELDAFDAISFVLGAFEVFVWELSEIVTRDPNRGRRNAFGYKPPISLID